MRVASLLVINVTSGKAMRTMPTGVAPRDLSIRTRTLGFLVTLCLAAVAVPAAAEITALEPSTPTSRDVIRVTISYQNIGCVAGATTAIAGTTIRTEISLRGCAYLPPATSSMEERFGPLPAGLYTYEVYTELAGAMLLNDRRTVVITQAPAPIPVLGTSASVLLVAAIAALAFLRLK